MVTFVGTQKNFADALKELIELEYAAVDSYGAAIERLENTSYQEKLKEFKKDHERHVEEVSALLRENNHEVPQKGDTAKQILTIGKVLLANLVGDKAILQAMKSNEGDTNTAYERMAGHEGKWAEAADILDKALRDEKRHKAWLKNTLSFLEER